MGDFLKKLLLDILKYMPVAKETLACMHPKQKLLRPYAVKRESGYKLHLVFVLHMIQSRGKPRHIEPKYQTVSQLHLSVFEENEN
jgi:hypothetical protein